MNRHGRVPFSCQHSFELGDHVAAESWGKHVKKDESTVEWTSLDFRMGSFIGKGGFGHVIRARIRRSTLGYGRDCALKQISKSKVSERENHGKRAILLLLRETNIQSKYVESCELPNCFLDPLTRNQ